MTKARILIVEDEIIVARDLEQQITHLGYAVVGIAGRGDDAIGLAKEKRPDLVLMDIHLQGPIDGIQAADEIRRIGSAAIVYLTAHADESTLARACVTEPFGYILKPFNDRELRTAIEIALFKHAAEQRLRESEQRLATTLASIGEGVISTDVNGRVILTNPIAEKLTGWSAAKAQGKPLDDVFRVRQGDAGEALTARDGHEYLIEKTVAPLLDRQGTRTGEVIAFRDVTESKIIEKHLRHAQKMESIGHLAGGIAHDFGNLLTVILSGARLLLQGPNPLDPSPIIIRDIEQAAESGAELTRLLLAFSQRQVIKLKTVDLNRVISDHARMLSRLIGSHINLVFRLDARPGSVRVDPGQMAQILVNLAVNARDAMPTGGTLVIETSNITIHAPTTNTPPDMQPGCYRQLRVTDTGLGMDRGTRARIFEPFFTTKELGKGTGLGLATVYGIVKQSNGSIWVTSEPDRGTTFFIYLPEATEVAASSDVREAFGSCRGVENVLLVEDNDSVRKLCREILTVNGYKVLEARDGIEALEVTEREPGIDLLITDVMMPRMTGITLARTLLSQRPSLKVLYISAIPDHPFVHDGNRTSMLQKPFLPATLGHAVRQLLNGIEEPREIAIA